MRTPLPAELLQVWESGAEQPSAARALLLLGAALEGAGPETLAALPLGARDALLAELRERLFGPEALGIASCPKCSSAIEAAFRCADVLAQAAGASSRAREHALEIGGMRVRFRLPDSTDLLALKACADTEAARATLLARCVIEADCEGAPRSPRELAPAVARAVADAMAAVDPGAETRLAFVCPSCGHGWDTPFDIARFLWHELDAWARRMLRDIDTLARIYHWREADILALGPLRRQAYLELCAP